MKQKLAEHNKQSRKENAINKSKQLRNCLKINFTIIDNDDNLGMDIYWIHFHCIGFNRKFYFQSTP
ncbi:MAG: hypothetical protein FWE56_05960, partial [Candidatus Bathyarchaeota archaeon]|nr:hypothetical protein [Candidatus Termiticorpusculum sp.]